MNVVHPLHVLHFRLNEMKKKYINNKEVCVCAYVTLTHRSLLCVHRQATKDTINVYPDMHWGMCTHI